MRRIILASFLVIASMGGQATAAEFVASGMAYQMSVPANFGVPSPLSLHICGNNAVMIGVHVKANQFTFENTFPFGHFSLLRGPEFGGGPKQPLHPGEIVDRYTERNGMHSCPWGMFVTGVHIANNELLCAGGYGDYSQEIVDGDDEQPTVCNSMHCCPEGMAVTGIHASKNLLSCARFDPNRVGFGKAGWTGRVDLDTQRWGMHACPEGRPMLGIHEGRNLLTCIGPGIE